MVYLVTRKNKLPATYLPGPGPILQCLTLYLLSDNVTAMAQDVRDTYTLRVEDIYNSLNSGDQKVIGIAMIV